MTTGRATSCGCRARTGESSSVISDMLNIVEPMPSAPAIDTSVRWEVLARSAQAVIRRHGRFIVVDLLGPHCTISTSACNGGQTERIGALINHQCCEASGHDVRFAFIKDHGEEAYHAAVCAEVGMAAGQAVLISSAVNMI